MFNKFTRSCAQSDELEKGSALHSPLFRFLSFAVCLALMLGIFALMPFPVSALDDIDSELDDLGTINGFPIISENPLDPSTMLLFWDTYHVEYNDSLTVIPLCLYNDIPYIPYNGGNSFLCIQLNNVYQNSNGNISWKENNTSGGSFTVGIGGSSSFNPSGLNIEYFNNNDYLGYGVNFGGRHYMFDFFYDFNGSNCTSVVDPSKAAFYWVFVPNLRNYENSKRELPLNILLPLSDGSGFVSPSSRPEADFVQFPVRDDDKFYIIDWISDGYQYPIFDFWINDKNNLHTYSLKFSSNSSFAQDLYDQEQQNGDNKYYSIANYLKLIGQHSIYDLQWDYVWSLSDSNLQFTNSNIKAFSINLSDYFSLTKFLVYRCQIVDNNTGSIIATTYFTTNRNFNKSNSGYGSNVYEYTNKDNLITDTTNNNGYSNGYINADTSTSGNAFVSDNPNDIVQTYDPTNLNIDISSIFGVLNQSTQGIGSFFQACFNVIPAAVLSIITAAVALLVILRILGR